MYTVFLYSIDVDNMWTDQEIQFLQLHYPSKGKMWCVTQLNKTEQQVRYKASQLKLRQDRNSEFFKDWQERARKSKIGKKRPDQVLVIKRLIAEGKLGKLSEQQKQINVARLKNHIATNGHPKGALGMKHSAETKKTISQKSKEFWDNATPEYKSDVSLKALKTKVAKGISIAPRKASWKAGWREIGGIKKYYRSRWEANYARYLVALKDGGLIQDWKHEPTTFWFEAIKRGTRSYLPDFLVVDLDGAEVYHEVKGWMDDRSKTKLKRMKIYHPNVCVKVIEKAEYKALAAEWSAKIGDWEYDSKGKP